jgi:cytidylate kinase
MREHPRNGRAARSWVRAERDRRDRERSVAPLVAAPDARILDTSALSVAESSRVLEGWVVDAFGEIFVRQSAGI